MRPRPLPWLLLLVPMLACGGGEQPASKSTTATAPAAPPRRDGLVGGPSPALFVAQAQFVERPGPDGKPASIPGPAKLLIVRKTDKGWQTLVLEDPDSNVFHKAVQTPEGLLTIGG